MATRNEGRHTSVWLPFTQMKTLSELPRVKSGEGIMLELEDGRQLMDCISSWWVTLHGHAQPEIAEAISRQARTLEHVICAGLIHEPAEKLADRLTGILPRGLEHVFYSDDGSTAVEVGLKMACQYWRNLGAGSKTRFLAFEGAYHGDTTGAMAVSHRSVFTDAFREMLFDVDFVPYPETFRGDPDPAAKEERALAVLADYLEKYGDQYAAVIIEPLVQGAGGMRMCRPEFLAKLRQQVAAYDILIIFDEVMVGFGRTGEFFACLKSGVTPDIICLSKGITGGFLPLAVTVCTETVYNAFYADDPYKTLYHGHSYTANPLGCAAGLASLDLLEGRQEGFRNMEAWHREGMEKLADHPLVEKLRICGTIAAMNIQDPSDSGYLSSYGPIIKKRFMEEGLLLRPLGNVLYILPPYCISKAQLDSVYSCIRDVLNEL
ncbi:MAG TPA: adenosylmethionine--8-amino-7-oxononanoate transaminase [Desulfosalsimonadaceae bacterium]|nr:adenosylmethionine--8-amino-7-oxononanoate transaminase [Desulfosalsimonadaceae bacterium]